jgi:alpha-amylase/alpha-mannosidase (GH57 family)
LAAYSFFLKTLIITFCFSPYSLNHLNAATNIENDKLNYTHHLEELKKSISESISKNQKNTAELLKKISRNALAPEEGPKSFAGGASSKKTRRSLDKFFDASLKMTTKRIEELEKQRLYLKEEIQLAQSLENFWDKGKNIHSQKTLYCLQDPLKEAEGEGVLEKEISFGQILNPELEASSARSQGIWFQNTEGLYVQSCQSGEILFIEYVEGRGQVIGVQHLDNWILLYGNINEQSTKTLKVGMKIPAGAPLGIAKSRFYLEARNGSQAVDPMKLFSSSR